MSAIFEDPIALGVVLLLIVAVVGLGLVLALSQGRRGGDGDGGGGDAVSRESLAGALRQIEEMKADMARQADAHRGELQKLQQDLSDARAAPRPVAPPSSPPPAAADEDATMQVEEGRPASPPPAAAHRGGDGDQDEDATMQLSAPASRRPTTPAPVADEDATMQGAPAAAAAEDDHDATIMFSPAAAPAEDPDAGLPFLDVLAGEDQGKRFVLQFGANGVGRGGKSTVVINERLASRNHAVIDFTGRDFVLTDQGSTNGTKLNGKGVAECTLQFGDVIAVGKTEMRFTCEGHQAMDKDLRQAVTALETTVAKAPDFMSALRTLAFLLERDVARKKDAPAVWARLAKLEKAG